MSETELFEVENRWTGKVQFAAEIDINLPSIGVKIGAAIKWAFQTGADLTGADLTGAVLTGAVLRRAVLRRADLTGAVLRGAVLRGAVLRRADLTGADLTGAVLRRADLTGADLTGAVLRGAVLRGADLTGAVLPPAPIVPKIDVAIAAAIDAGGSLNMRDWHTCGTTHCRAGWAITLAGEAGAQLESKIGPAAAGALIYAASRPGKPVPNFYASNSDAMDDIRACAAEQAAAP